MFSTSQQNSMNIGNFNNISNNRQQQQQPSFRIRNSNNNNLGAGQSSNNVNSSSRRAFEQNFGPNRQQNSNLVSCTFCNARMTETQLATHWDGGCNAMPGARTRPSQQQQNNGGFNFNMDDDIDNDDSLDIYNDNTYGGLHDDILGFNSNFFNGRRPPIQQNRRQSANRYSTNLSNNNNNNVNTRITSNSRQSNNLRANSSATNNNANNHRSSNSRISRQTNGLNNNNRVQNNLFQLPDLMGDLINGLTLGQNINDFDLDIDNDSPLLRPPQESLLQQQFRIRQTKLKEKQKLKNALAKVYKITVLNATQAAKAKKEEIVCSICLGDFQKADKQALLSCKHVFHQPCIDKWMEQKKECPLCKKKFE